MNPMALFTMPHMGLENGIRTIEKDNRSSVPMGNHQLTRSYNRPRGFTLIELLVTLAILAIIAVIAAPSLQNFVLNNRIRSQAAALTSSLIFARTEAITRGTLVVACARPATNDSCECGGKKWEDGWIVFVDENNGTEEEAECVVDGLLEVHGPLDGSKTTLRGVKGNIQYSVFFRYDGRVQKPSGKKQQGTFVLCDQRGWGSDARAIQVLPTGRSRNLIATDDSLDVGDCKPES